MVHGNMSTYNYMFIMEQSQPLKKFDNNNNLTKNLDIKSFSKTASRTGKQQPVEILQKIKQKIIWQIRQFGVLGFLMRKITDSPRFRIITRGIQISRFCLNNKSNLSTFLKFCFATFLQPYYKLVQFIIHFSLRRLVLERILNMLNSA